MQISVLLFRQILSMFIMILMGYVIVRAKLLKSEESRGISIISLYLIMPCVILDAFQVDYTQEIVRGLILAFAAAVLVHILLLLLIIPAARIARLDAVERASVIYSNAGNLIVPIVTTVFGKEWVIYSCAFICVQLVLIWSHCRTILSGENRFEFRKIICNANMIAIAVGIVLFLTNTKLPGIAADTVSAVGGMIAPISMMVIGMLIAGMDLKQVFTKGRIYKITALRMLVFPLIMLLVLKFSGLHGLAQNGDTILLITFLASMTPPASTVTQMSQLYGRDAQYAGAINVLSTLVCIVTMPMMVYLYLQ